MSSQNLTSWQLAKKSLFHFWRSNMAVVCGVLVATAVLTGALVVGDSMRTSLKRLTLERLGRIDEILVSDGFFRAELADEIKQTAAFEKHYDSSMPLILFPNGNLEAEADGTLERASGINVFGVTPEFWTLGSLDVDGQRLTGKKVVVNQTLANELNLTTGDDKALTLRIPKPTQLPADSALGKQDDLVEAIVDLELLQIVPNESLGRFSLHPSQSAAPNIYLPIEVIQKSLSRGALDYKEESELANVLILSYKQDVSPNQVDSTQIENEIQPKLADHGFQLKHVAKTYGSEAGQDPETLFDYWSLATDRLVLSREAVGSIEAAFPGAKPVFTYLANDIKKPGTECGVPLSMISAIDFDSRFVLTDSSGSPIAPLKDNELVLVDWAAENLGVQIGDEIEIVFFEPETTHGAQKEKSATFKLAAIASLTDPSEPYKLRGGRLFPNKFSERPTRANDPDLTPEVPGLTDAETIESWDLPFATDRTRPEDEVYWDNHRTTPKAYISLNAGQKLWASRFGTVTSFQIFDAGSDQLGLAKKLEAQLQEDNAKLGFSLVPIKRNGLAASAGSTPFDVLFLSLSMFVIGAALILVSLLFRLGLQSRAAEVGLLEAVGMKSSRILGIWLREMLLVCSVGAVLGMLAGIGYASLMILGLKTWWVGAISEPFIELNLSPVFLLIGFASGVMICVLTIWWSLKRATREPVRRLLAGELEQTEQTAVGTSGKLAAWIPSALIVCALGLSIFASTQNGDTQAGSFMGSGFLVLFAILIGLYRWFCQPAGLNDVNRLGLGKLARMNATRNPLRSTLTIGLVASASFLIVAVSSFRLSPSERGTAGYDYLATSSQPIFGDLNQVDVREELLGVQNKTYPVDAVVHAFRFKPGDDASCNNVYQSSQPRVLGVTDAFVEAFDSEGTGASPEFGWAGSAASTEEERANPWRLLKSQDVAEGIPCVLDKNTAFYSLKIFSIGQTFAATYDSGQSVTFRVVGFLDNTVLQGSLICSEENFVSAFPEVAGYRFFMIRDGKDNSVVPILEESLTDQGFDATSAPERLAQFMQVQNTYLSTFQALGALGLLLGTFGLAAVQIRNIVQRQSELGLMRAIGFRSSRLTSLVLIENSFLLLAGLLAGVFSAACATIPHFVVGSASVPWVELICMFAAIAVVGVVVSWVASWRINRMPLLESLRA